MKDEKKELPRVGDLIAQADAELPRIRRDVILEEDFIQLCQREKVKSAKKDRGARYNTGKVRWRNFPLWLCRPLADVGTYGESKYETFNFLKGLSVADTMDCLYRHLEAVDNPGSQDNDAESKCHHLAHVAWNALVALQLIQSRPELDDRYKTKLKEQQCADQKQSEVTSTGLPVGFTKGGCKEAG